MKKLIKRFIDWLLRRKKPEGLIVKPEPIQIKPRGPRLRPIKHFGTFSPVKPIKRGVAQKKLGE